MKEENVFIDDYGMVYRLDKENKTAEIFASTKKLRYKKNSKLDIIIPSKIEVNGDNYTVTSIGKGALNCSNMNSIYIPETIVSIGEYAFSSSYVKKVFLNEGLKEICNHAFNDTPYLTYIALPKTLEKIGKCAFYDGNLQDSEIVIPGSVKIVSNGAFETMFGEPKKIIIKDGVEKIMSAAFGYIRREDINLIEIPESVDYIGPHAFGLDNDCITNGKVIVKNKNCIIENK